MLNPNLSKILPIRKKDFDFQVRVATITICPFLRNPTLSGLNSGLDSFHPQVFANLLFNYSHQVEKLVAFSKHLMKDSKMDFRLKMEPS